MKKSKLLVLSLCLIMSVAGLFACEKASDVTVPQPEVSLDLFEEKVLTLPEGVEGDANWASSDEETVTVNGGVLSATGKKEGAATITATVGDSVYSYPVTVTDSGDRPVLSVESISVYKGKTADLKTVLSLSYKNEPIVGGVTFTYRCESEAVTVSDDGILTGVTAGPAVVQVKATYKGFTTAAKNVSVTIEESDIVKPEHESVTLSVIDGDTDPTYYDIAADVYVNAEKVTGAEITAEITSGSEYVELDGLRVKAKAVGKAVLTLVYENAGVTVSGTLKVNVRDDSVEYKAGTMLQPVQVATFNKVLEGDFVNCYEYKLGTEGNYWSNAIIESTSLTSIVNNGYKTFSYDVYFVDSAAFVAYIPSAFQNADSSAYAIYDLAAANNKFTSSAMGKYTGDDDLLHIYKDGTRLADGTELQKNTWYTVVYDLSTYSDGWSMMGFSINEATPNGQKTYLRNFAFHTTANLLPKGTYDERHPIGDVDDPEVTDDADDFLNNLTISSNAVSVKKVDSGKFVGSYKIRSQTAATSGKITFNDIHNAANEPKRFFTEGYHYVKFDLYILSGDGLGICNWVKAVNSGEADVKLETTITGALASYDTVIIYNERGNESRIGIGAWYTIVVNIPYDDDNLPTWDLFYIGLSGSKYVPSTGYIKNFEYLKEAPVIEGDDSEIAKSITTTGTLVKQAEAVDGVEGAYYYKNTDENWYSGRLEFEALKHKDKVVSLKVRFESAERPYFCVGYDNSYQGGAGWVYDDVINYFDLEGTYVKAPVADTWYILIVDLSKTKDQQNNWIYYITLNKDASMYIADLKMLDSNPYTIPEPDTSMIAQYITTPSTLTKQTAAVGGVEGAYLYENDGGNWYTGGLSFLSSSNAFVITGKVITLKVRLFQEATIIYSITYENNNQGSWSHADKIKYYDSVNSEVTALAKDVWYTVVIDLSGTSDSMNYISLAENNKMYIADLKILDTNPYNQAA